MNNKNIFADQLKTTEEALRAAVNYIKLLEMHGAQPTAVGLAKKHYEEKKRIAYNGCV